jgi:lipopolysaccharide export system permease protein
MTIFDRYLIKLFLRTFAICFFSFSGLFIIIHMFSNLDDLARLAKTSGGWPVVMQQFYLPRLADIFDKTSAMMSLFAAIFAVTLMQRRREVTAVQAAGLPLSRVLRPVLLLSLVIVGVAAFNREYLLPKVRMDLVRKPQEWAGDTQLPMAVQDDWRSGVRLRGRHVVVADRAVVEPDVQLPFEIGHSAGIPITHLRAESATVQAAIENHPAGLLLQNVTEPKDIDSVASVSDGKSFAVLTSADQGWIKSGQCFVACSFDVQRMAYGRKLDQFRTVPEIMTAVREPQTSFGRSDRLALHSRLIRPLLDYTLILLGLPLILSQIDRNVFLSAGLCLVVVAVFQISVTVSQSLGGYRIVQPAALAAWLPLIIFGPLAVLSQRKLR